MISHKYKCIFIHIAKCAGSTVEDSFGRGSAFEADYEKVFGWDEKLKIFLQHATPQQLLDNKLISKSNWNEYYKFIIIRNSWDKSISDYRWLIKDSKIVDTFENYITKSGKFSGILNYNKSKDYRGDHLIPQKDYFYINNRKINYDKVINFNRLSSGFLQLKEELNLPNYFFKKKLKSSKSKKHYSRYYSDKMIKLVQEKYKNDISFFNFEFNDKRFFWDNLKNQAFQKTKGIRL